MKNETQINPSSSRTFVERLVDIADDIFDRATNLDRFAGNLKENDEASIVYEIRNEAFEGVIQVWSVIIDMLPTSGLEQAVRKSLEMDGHKVMSRCFHRLKMLSEAKAEIIAAIDLGYHDGFISLGAIQMDSEEFEGAEKAFKSALAKEVQVMRAHAGLGELYFLLGTNALKEGSEKHVEYFEKAEQAFLLAGKERFTEGYERAMDLFEAIGWKDKALSFGQKAVQFYEANRLSYGDKLRHLDARLRTLTGGERYDRLVAGVGRSLGNLVGGDFRSPDQKKQ